MSHSLERLNALRTLNPDKWAKQITVAMGMARGHLDEAADLLGVSLSTLKRWLAEPALATVPRAARGRNRRAHPLPKGRKK